MKTRHIIVSMLIAFGFASVLQGAIINTKHNMSTSGPGALKSTGEQEVCVFCHIPHNSQAGAAPLWNRSMSAASYTMYNSDYLRRMNYPTPTALGTAPGTPGTLSRQCLSCHDGTVAIGSVYVVRGTLMGSTLIPMSNVNPDGTMQATIAGYIGTDLRGHHPVGIEYNHQATKNFGTGSRGIELKPIPGNDIKLYTYNGKQYVECSSCHDPHTETAKFLRYSSGGSHGANVYGTCTSCHDKTNWATGAHATVNNTYTDTTVNAAYGTSTVSSLGCVNCHKPHNGEGKPYLLRKVEENTCFQGAGSGTTSTVPCHGVGGAKDIELTLSRVYKHPVNDLTLQGNHSNLDVLFGVSVISDGGTGVTWSANKHAECTDCHNPHQAQAGAHTPAAQWYPTTPSSMTNLTSNSGPLRGVTGVEPSWTSIGWTQPTTFTTLESSTKEYQICLKCHSYWGLGSASNGSSSHLLSNYSGMYATDQAYEFNPINRSAHPVVMTINEMQTYGGNAAKNPANEGRYAPPLTGNALASPWNANPGNQTMMCSDCHGADNEAGGDPKGPHGSSYAYMLKGTYKNWPAGPDGSGTAVPGGRLYTMGDGQTPGKQIFCLNCHIYEPNDGTIHVHTSSSGQMTNNACVECHVAVPHGSKVSRLVGYASMPSPYNYTYNGRAYLGMSGYRAQGASTYTSGSNGKIKDNAYSTDPNCFTTNCHNNNKGGYDVYP